MLDKTGVQILLALYQSNKYLSEQLISLSNQGLTSFSLLVSDDSCHTEFDEPPDRGQVREAFEGLNAIVQKGPRRGFAQNFVSLVRSASDAFDYYAFCDQDDVWESHKLQRAVDYLDTIPEAIPALYCSRTRLVDEQNREIGFSPLFTRPPSFKNALTQNIAGGNTMVFNAAARDLFLHSDTQNIVSHDWWLYLVVTGCGGHVFYDPEPTVRYRQHAANAVGSNSSWLARLSRIRRMLDGQLRQWIDQNLRGLRSIEPLLTPANREALCHFVRGRDGWLPARLYSLWLSGVYRQTLFGNLGLFLAAVLKKI